MQKLFDGAIVGYYDRTGLFHDTSRGCYDFDSMLQLEPQHLDNYIYQPDCVLSQEANEMASKINRKVMIGGKLKWIHADTEQEYLDKILKLTNTDSSNAAKHNFADYARKWFEIYSKPNISSVTAITYERQLDLYLIPAFGNQTVEDITTDDVQRLFNEMTGSKSTKDKTKIVLNMILDTALDDGLIPKNPLKSKRLKITGKASQFTKEYSVEQMQYLISHIGSVKKPLDRAYLAVQALHPLRLEEVLGLKWSDVDLDNMTLHIVRAVTHPDRNKPEIKTPKTAASIRDIGLSQIAAKYLERSGDSDFVFGGEKPLSYQQVKRMCERIKKDTGFDDKITPIRFRTTVLTDIYDCTKDVKAAQAAAGHTTSAMTLKHYVKGRSSVQSTASAIDSIYGTVTEEVAN